MAVVYQSEAGRFASTVLCAEPEAGYLVFVGFVELGELLTEFVFGYIGAVGVEDVTRGWERSEGSPCVIFQEGRGLVSIAGLWGTHTTICFRPRRAFRMNLRVRSVTGCSLSAMLAGCIVLLAKTLGILEMCSD